MSLELDLEEDIQSSAARPFSYTAEILQPNLDHLIGEAFSYVKYWVLWACCGGPLVSRGRVARAYFSLCAVSGFRAVKKEFSLSRSSIEPVYTTEMKLKTYGIGSSQKETQFSVDLHRWIQIWGDLWNANRTKQTQSKPRPCENAIGQPSYPVEAMPASNLNRRFEIQATCVRSSIAGARTPAMEVSPSAACGMVVRTTSS